MTISNLHSQSHQPYSDLPPLNHHHPENNKDSNIDVLNVIATLYKNKKTIISATFAAILLAVLFTLFTPKEWTSDSIITPAEDIQWQELNKKLSDAMALDIEPNLDQKDVFNAFIKKFKSKDELESFLLSSEYVHRKITGHKLDADKTYNLLTSLASNMSSEDGRLNKKNASDLFTSWTLKFTADSSEDAKALLKNYIDHISSLVVDETLRNLTAKIRNKSEFEKKRLEIDQAKLESILATKASGIRDELSIPAISEKQSNNEYSASHSTQLQAVDSISSKLQIESAITDIALINNEILNRKFIIEKLDELNVDNTTFQPFKYQAMPSQPITHNGPKKSLIIVLFALLGCMLSCAVVLFRDALSSRQQKAL